jgi:hypothetical protein
VALVAFGAILSYPTVLPSNPADRQVLAKILLLYTAAPMLVLAVLIAVVTSATRHPGEA